jgi:hypothetical protein
MGEIVEVSRKGLRIHKGYIPPIIVKLAHGEKMDYFQDQIKQLEEDLAKVDGDLSELVALRTFREMLTPTCPQTLKPASLFMCAGAIRKLECKSCKPRDVIINQLVPRLR